MTWRTYTSFWLSGLIFGLCITQFVVSDPTVSWALVMAIWGVLAIQLLLLLISIREANKYISNFEREYGHLTVGDAIKLNKEIEKEEK